MSSVIVAAQRKHGCVHVATDALSYTREQAPSAFGPKIYTVPQWPGAIASVGACSSLVFLAPMLAQQFQTFDEFIDGGNAALPGVVIAWRESLTEMGHPPVGSDVIVTGISKQGPRVFSFRTNDDLPPGVTRQEAHESPYYPKQPAEMIELPDEISTPVPHDQVIPAEWDGFALDDDPEQVRWSLKKFLMMQRHMKLPDGVGGIGGHGACTTIYADRIEQRILLRWSDDELGTPLRIEPIDWKSWHVENPRPAAPNNRSTRTPLRVVS